ncbi:magnesium-translocating P-type ATPase [Prosthecomicrobium pneumaticum]|uniref:Magnesium-transporting ATPase, P-type 1 n=1 Tax=Prosthecomicrobium pneumaticum TaxID=81895 RepID=A0A7W9FLL1_9HYPH|nr:magnesium-translocating P-type ATPase [Prosthecomicrobium pneumaticum]MBB5752913.1 Mg2+-importing ATPase [Prosthecomicrobium pneumaticum]
MPQTASEVPFWSRDAAAACAELQTRPEGLTSAEAAERLSRLGPNRAVAARRRSVVGKIARRLVEPLIAILLIAAAVSGAMGDWRSFVVILGIVLVSTALDVIQEEKAENAVEALQRSVAVTARVRRDGRLLALPVRDIVPGDVIRLAAGDLVPADGVLLESRGALADEALLTGEPYPVEKRPGRSEATGPAEAFNAVFAGTSLVAGEAVMLAVATGGGTRFGAIAAALAERAAPSAFERGLHALGLLILRLTGFLVLVVLLARLAAAGLSLDTFLFAVALAVGLTPELLPMVLTVTLSRGALRMAARKVVVKRLSAIDDLGAMDVLCTDKTGTLTEARIALVGGFGPDGAPSRRAAALAGLNSRFATGLGSNLDAAILAAVPADPRAWARCDDRPFDFTRRRASVLLADGAERLMVTKGAPEDLLSLATRLERPDGAVVPLDETARATAAAWITAQGAAGFRLLGIGWRAMPEATGRLAAEDEADLVLAGFVAFLDPPKASAAAAIGRLAAAGVRVKIVSGDAEPVVRHIVDALGLPSGSAVLSGAEIAATSDAALAARAEVVDLFVRVSPDQKARIVRALRRRGRVTGFLGDGINDAPAIHAADVGLSVSGGSDVARQAADVILLAPDLGVLADGVAEGRRTCANIMKYVRMVTSSNFGNMLSMALASLVLPFLPLAPLQILLNNLLYDLSEIGIPFDAADPSEVERPARFEMRDVLRFTLVMGPLSSLFDAATFALLHFGFAADVAVFRTAWFVESIATQILVIFIIRTARPAWSARPHPVLAATSLGALAVALLFALSPLGGFAGFVPLPPAILATIAAICCLYLILAEALKRLAIRPAPAGR